MFKRVLFAAMLVGLVALPFTNASAEGMPEHVRAALNKMRGEWQAETTIGGETGKWEISLSWSPTKDSLIYHWTGPDYVTGKSNSGTGIFGWDGAKRLVTEYEVEGSGSVYASTHHITEDGHWHSLTRATVVTDDGISYLQYERTFQWTNDDEWVIKGKNRVLDGKKQPDEKTILKRGKN